MKDKEYNKFDDFNDYNNQEIDLEKFMKKNCPVKVGDIIYRKNNNIRVPDRMEVTEIIPNDSGYFIKIRYLYHINGPQERIFSDIIFNDNSWVIES